MRLTSRCSGCRGGSRSTRPSCSGGSTSSRAAVASGLPPGRAAGRAGAGPRGLRPGQRRLPGAARSDRAGRVPGAARRGARDARGRRGEAEGAARACSRRCSRSRRRCRRPKSGGARRRRRRATLTEQRERLQARACRGGSAAARAAQPGVGRRRARRAGAGCSPRFKESLATRAYLRTVIDDLDRGAGEGHEEDACRASSALISARPTAWSPTSTRRPVCPWSSPIATGRYSCRRSSAFTRDGVAGGRGRAAAARAPAPAAPSTRSSG